MLVDVNDVGLDGLTVDPAAGVLRLGAPVRHRAVELSPAVATAAPLLAAAAAWVGHPAIRHRGTLGGSLAHADPAAELPAALVALDADVVVRGPGGTRHLATASLATAPFETALARDEMVVEVLVPLDDAGHRAAAFCEWAPRHRDRAEAGVGITLTGHPGRPGVRAGAGAACGFGTGPVDLTPVLDDALRSEPVARTSPLPSSATAAAVDGARRARRRRRRPHGVGGGRWPPTRAVRAHRGLARRWPADGDGRRRDGPPVKVAVNGEPVEAVVEPRDRLADLVRDAGLTGAHARLRHRGLRGVHRAARRRTVRSCLVLAGSATATT